MHLHQPPAAPPPRATGPSVDVLVVEDEDDIRETLAETLTLEGFAVATARNGREALDVLRKARPRVLIIDLMMPVMSGWDLLDVIKCDETLASIPVLVMTAVQNPRRPRSAPVFLKPLNLQSLVRAVRTYASPDGK